MCRRLILSSILTFFACSGFAQIVMTNGSVTSCGDVFLDPGGAGNYPNGATLVMTINPVNAGDGVCLDFTSWDLDYSIFGYAELSFYDGTTTGAPLIMTATGDWVTNPTGTAFDFTGPGMVCANGPMTIEWNPDGTAPGWTADITCFTPLGPAGCNITASANVTTTCSGDPVNLSAVGNIINSPLSNDFNGSTIGTGWNSTVNARFDNPCGPGLDGTPHLWMGVEPAPRSLSSQPYDVSLGGTISFEFKMATQAQASPCEGPDLEDEGVYLQYSTNGGTNWTTMHYFFPPFYTDGSQHCTSWQNYVFNIPPAAQTANTTFRWIQNEISSNSTDHWGMDNVVISFPNSSTISWDQGLGAGANHTVNPTATTTYTVTIDDGNTSCQDQVTITVNNCSCTPPTVTTTNPATLCQPSTYDLNNGVAITGAGTSSFYGSVADANAPSNAISNVVNATGTYYVRVEDPLDANCFTLDSVTVTIDPLEDPGFTYSAAAYCLTDANPTPTVSGTGGGAFTFSPAGISVNGTSGTIDLTSSTAGAYNITYTTPGTCFDDSTFQVTLTAAPDPAFSYDAANYCITGSNPVITITGTAGTFSATPAGLTINPATGAIDLSTSSTGTYTVNNDIAASGPCAAVNANVSVTIDPQEDAGFSYATNTICLTGANPTATITGTINGSFTSTPAGISVNGTTGEIDLTTSSAGTYDITYTTPGACFADSTVQVTLTTSPDATFNYDAANYCITGANPVITITGSAGNFSATPAGLTINPTTGAIDLSTSTAGTYTVNNDIAASGSCAAVNFNVVVTIDPQEDAGFSYATNTICLTGANPTATITGTINGAFISTPAGISVNGTTGEIDLTTSSAGTYDITYTTPGACFADSTVQVTLTTSPDATFNYDAANYCITGANPVITITGSAGTFSATPAGLTINPTTGAIDLSTSIAGTYTVNNDIAASGSCAAVNFNVVVTIDPQEDAGFSYSTNTICLTGANPTATITGTINGAFTSTPAGITVNGTTGEIDLTTSSAGTYDITYTTPGACFADSTVQVTLTTSPDATFNYDAATYCQTAANPVITITGGAGTFSATPAGLTINPTTGAIDLTTSAAGVYTVTNNIAATGGCPAATFNTAVTVIATPAAPTTTGDGTYCEGDVIPALTATGGAGTFDWYDDAALTNNVGTGASYNTGTLPVGTHIFYVVETDGACVGAPATVTITINELPVHNGITGVNTLCLGEQTTLTSSGIGTLSWSTTETTASIDVGPATTTWYYSTYTNSCGSATDSIEVIVNPLPTADAGTDVTIGLGQSTTLNGTGGSSFDWTPASDLDCSTCQDPLASPLVTTTFYLTVTDGNNCSAIDSVTVTVDDNFDVFIPNVFSPNGDSKNDILFVRGSAIESLEYLVYDRWGEKIFESNSVSDGWDGTFRGTPVPTGVYVYYVRAFGFGATEPTELKGNITLVR